MEIKKVAIIGMGAMGLLLASELLETMDPKDLFVVADRERIERYQQAPFTVNGVPLDLQFISPEDFVGAVDLAIFAVKYRGLEAAMHDMRRHIDGHTTIISILNGIVSEEDLAKYYDENQVLYVVAQGMDATREGQAMTYSTKGELAIGYVEPSQKERYEALRAFLVKTGIPFVEPEDIKRQLWSKFMFNVGVNQVVGVYGGGYGVVQRNEEARQKFRDAMAEVIPLARAEGVNLNFEDIETWTKVADNMGPTGKPSMLQDLEAGRPSEVGLFAGTVLRYAKKHNMSVPVNQWLYTILSEKNLEIEKQG